MYFPSGMLVEERVQDCSLERYAGLTQIIPSLEQQQHIAFSILIETVHKVCISILLRKSAADLAKPNLAVEGSRQIN